jgi:hypothetical protein
MRTLAVALLVFVAAPAHAGSYGSYVEPRKGYSIAKDVSVGAMSDHRQEADVYRNKEERAKKQIAALVPMYDAWVARASARKGYAGWLGAWDRDRANARQSDYKWRIPGPRHIKPTNPDPLALELDDGRGLQIYLHVKPSATQVQRGRALVGFALAEAEAGDDALTKLGDEDLAATKEAAATRLDRAEHFDSFAGQPASMAGAVLALARAQGQLVALVSDAKTTPSTRLLARLLLHGYKRDVWTAADWTLAEACEPDLDRRMLWTWLLVFNDEASATGLRAELQRRWPLSEEDKRYFLAEFVDGKGE